MCNQKLTSGFYYLAGMSGLGVAFGFMVGLSKSPVVAATIPVLVGIITAISQFVFNRDSGQSAEAEKSRTLVSKSLFAFVGIFTLCLFSGMIFREPVLRCELIDIGCDTGVYPIPQDTRLPESYCQIWCLSH